MTTDINVSDLEKQVVEDERKDLEAFQKGEAEAPILYRQVAGAVKKMEDGEGIQFILSHESEDRLGDIVRVDGWDLKMFKKNPVMLWAHDNRLPPIGRWANVSVDGKSLVGTAVFDDDQFSRTIENKVRRGFLNAVSVGFRPTEFKALDSDNPWGGIEFTKQELLETSVVSVPAHPRALRKALAELDDLRSWSFMPSNDGNHFIAMPHGLLSEKPEDKPEPVVMSLTGDPAMASNFLQVIGSGTDPASATTTTISSPDIWTRYDGSVLTIPTIGDDIIGDPEPEDMKTALKEVDDDLEDLEARVERLEKLVLTGEVDDDEQPSSPEDADTDKDVDDGASPESDLDDIDETRGYREDMSRFLESLTKED